MTTAKKGLTPEQPSAIVGIVVLLVLSVFLMGLVYSYFASLAQGESGDGNIQATAGEHESPIWTVTGPFEAQGSHGSAGEMFLLDHPTLGRRMVSGKEIAGLEGSESGVKREIPYAVVERSMTPGYLYTPVLWVRK